MGGVEVGLIMDEVRTLVLDSALELAVLVAEALIMALCWWLYCIRCCKASLIRKRLNLAKFLLVVRSS